MLIFINSPGAHIDFSQLSIYNNPTKDGGVAMQRPETFANRLLEAIALRKVSKAELSRAAGISKSSITRYTKGDWEGKQDAVYALAKALNVDEAWLMGYDVPMERQKPWLNLKPGESYQLSINDDIDDSIPFYEKKNWEIKVRSKLGVLSMKPDSEENYNQLWDLLTRIAQLEPEQVSMTLRMLNAVIPESTENK